MSSEEDDAPPGMADSLMAFVLEADEFPSSERAKEILAEDGVDVSGLTTWTRQKLSGIRARKRLQEAKEKREACLKMIGTFAGWPLTEAKSLREGILAKLRVLVSSDPDAAFVYCRRFEEAPDEDLPGLEADLNLLDILIDETGEPD